jgi:hypothetical protein
VPARFRVERAGVLVEHRRQRGRVGVDGPLKCVVDFEDVRRRVEVERLRRAAHQHPDLVPVRIGLDLSGFHEVAAKALIVPADVLGAEVEQPSPARSIEFHDLERQPVAEIPVPLVPGGVSRDARAAEIEIDQPGQRSIGSLGRRGRRRWLGCRRGLSDLGVRSDRREAEHQSQDAESAHDALHHLVKR